METDNVENVLANQANRNTIVEYYTPRLSETFGFKEEFYFRVGWGGGKEEGGKIDLENLYANDRTLM